MSSSSREVKRVAERESSTSRERVQQKRESSSSKERAAVVYRERDQL